MEQKRTIKNKETVLEELNMVEAIEQVEAFFKGELNWSEMRPRLEGAFNSLSEEGKKAMKLLGIYLEAFSESMEPERRDSLQKAVCDAFWGLSGDDQKVLVSHFADSSL